MIFTNRNFLSLTEEKATQFVSGQRLEDLLLIDSRSAEKIISIIASGGMVEKLPITLTTTSEKALPVLLSGVATYGARGNFIGADLWLQKQIVETSPDSPTIPTLRHTGVLRVYVDEVFSETRSRRQTFMQAYVMAQVEMLQVLLARMGGPEARNTLERMVNEILGKHGIPALMQNGYLEFQQTSLDISVYRLILRVAIHYSTTVIGQRLVGQEMLKIDSQMDSGVLQLITQMDLRPTHSLN